MLFYNTEKQVFADAVTVEDLKDAYKKQIFRRMIPEYLVAIGIVTVVIIITVFKDGPGKDVIGAVLATIGIMGGAMLIYFGVETYRLTRLYHELKGPMEKKDNKNKAYLREEQEFWDIQSGIRERDDQFGFDPSVPANSFLVATDNAKRIYQHLETYVAQESSPLSKEDHFLFLATILAAKMVTQSAYYSTHGEDASADGMGFAWDELRDNLGHVYYFGDRINEYLAFDKYCVWNMAAARPKEAGVQIPDISQFMNTSSQKIRSSRYRVWKNRFSEDEVLEKLMSVYRLICSEMGTSAGKDYKTGSFLLQMAVNNKLELTDRETVRSALMEIADTLTYTVHLNCLDAGGVM